MGKPNRNANEKSKSKEKDKDNKKKPEVVAKVAKIRGTRPDFTPRVKKQSQEERTAAVSAEGTPEAKKALASGQNGLYFFRGAFFRICDKDVVDYESGVVRKTNHVIEDENHNHIPFGWVMVADYKWLTMELKGSAERVSAMKAIRSNILEYAGTEIKEAKTAYAMKRKQEEEQKAFVAKVAEAQALVRASASTDLPAMFWRRQDGTFVFPDGVVMKVTYGLTEVLIGNDEFSVSKRGKDIFSLQMSTLSSPAVHIDTRIKNEVLRNAMYMWQSKVHTYLLAVKAVTPQPAPAKAEVVASNNLSDMFRMNVAGNYTVGGLVVRLEKNQYGDCYRVLVGNDQVHASDKYFLPSHMLDKEIHPNGKISSETYRTTIHTWQVALQTALNAAKAKLPPVVVEVKSEVAEVATTDTLPQPIPAYTPSRLEIPSLKGSKRLTVEMLKSMPLQTNGLFHVQEGKGRAYFLAVKGKFWLIQKSDAFPEDHILARILGFHGNKELDESKTVYVDIQAIRQNQPLDEIADVGEYKTARKAMQRFLRRMMLEVAEVNSDEVNAPASSNSKDVSFPPNTALADLLANFNSPKVQAEKPQHIH